MKWLRAIIFGGVILLAVILGIRLQQKRVPTKKLTNCLRYQVVDNKATDCLLKFDLAQTPEEQRQGLSGRASLPDDQGLMFVFLSPATQCFWMKDMQFPIDIIWMNPAKEIVHIEQNVAPNTYPKPFCPQAAAQYVLEVNAGVANKLGINVGQKLTF